MSGIYNLEDDEQSTSQPVPASGGSNNYYNTLSPQEKQKFDATVQQNLMNSQQKAQPAPAVSPGILDTLKNTYNSMYNPAQGYLDANQQQSPSQTQSVDPSVFEKLRALIGNKNG